MSTSTISRRRQKDKQRKEKKRKGALPKGWRTAKTSDIHELYELSVQEPEADIDLVDQVWKEQRGRVARTMREDFCGTAIAAMEWVRRRPDNTAVGVDIDASVLDWARARMAERLEPEQAKRLTLIESDVLTVKTEPVDTILACNFSYYLLKTRAALGGYFRSAHQALVDDGMLLLDAYGGSDSFTEMEEERHLDGFTYVWDQASYDPISGDATNHIHFRFPDGTRIKKAFTYHWRLWTLPEIRELLVEAGFKDVDIYWEGTDEETEEGNGEWEVCERGEACPGWVAYLAAKK
jgi:SAM-dependent methyltransferase